MRKRLAYIFIFIFSFQVLPVKEVGKMLFKSQLTEEIHETAHNDDNPRGKSFLGNAPCLSIACLLQAGRDVAVAIQYADHIPVSHAPDILTPPPNC